MDTVLFEEEEDASHTSTLLPVRPCARRTQRKSWLSMPSLAILFPLESFDTFAIIAALFLAAFFILAPLPALPSLPPTPPLPVYLCHLRHLRIFATFMSGNASKYMKPTFPARGPCRDCGWWSSRHRYARTDSGFCRVALIQYRCEFCQEQCTQSSGDTSQVGRSAMRT